MGTPPGMWEKEDSKVYDNSAEAHKDAKKRLNEARRKYRGRKKASLSDKVVGKLLEKRRTKDVS
jgi:hypothetical protein